MKRRGVTVALLVLMTAGLAGLAGRCVYLQVLQADYYRSKALRQQRALVPRRGGRGLILDRCGRVLAASNQVRNLYAEPRELKDPKETAVQLAAAISLPAHEICRRIVDSPSPAYARIKRDVDADEARAALAIRGVHLEYDWQRYYPLGSLTCHVVGFTDPYGRGLAGLEAAYENILAGQAIRQEFLADSARRPLRPLSQAAVLNRPLHGRSLILTIDATVQEFARRALAEQLAHVQAESALAIVAEVKTGAILAMVSLPDFDPAQYRHATEAQRCNHAVIDQYEPGSIIKPLVVALALDAGVIRPDEEIFCEDGLFCGKGFRCIREFNYHRYGNLTPKGILINSSNIGMAKIGLRLGARRLHDGLRLLGFGTPVGIALPGEAKGLLRPVDHPVYPWRGDAVTRISFGQGLAVSALQLIRAYCTLANGGRPVEPYLIEAVVDPDGTTHSTRDAYQVANQLGSVIDPGVARWVVQQAMVAVVNEGSGRRARLDRWQVFGKTGTAQIARSDGKGYTDDNIASFVAGAPAEDPAVVMLVSIRKPNRQIGRSGGVVAAPVAGRILGQTLDYFESMGWLRPPRRASGADSQM